LEEYVFTSRSGACFSREIMMSPKAHWNNLKLVKMQKFWDNVVAALRVLHQKTQLDFGSLIEKVACNFGEWESQIAEDKFSLECHGHIHIILSKDCQASLAATGGFAPLQGRELDPPQYELDNVALLEREIMSLEISEILHRLDRLETKLNILLALQLLQFLLLTLVVLVVLRK